MEIKKKKSTLSKVFSITSSVLLIVLGILAIVSRDFFSASLGIIAGSILIVIGLLIIVYALFASRLILGSGWLFIQGMIAGAVGIFLVINSDASIAIITYALGFWLLASGISKFVNSFDLKKFRVKTWYVTMIIGIFDIVLSIILFSFSGTAGDVISILLGIFLILSGIGDIIELFDSHKRENREQKIINNINKNVDHLDNIDFDFTKDEK